MLTCSSLNLQVSTIFLISWTTKIPNLNRQFNVKKIHWGPIHSRNTFTVTSHTKRKFCVSEGFTVWQTKNCVVPSDVCRTKLTPNIAWIHKINTGWLSIFETVFLLRAKMFMECNMHHYSKWESPSYKLWNLTMQRVTLAVFGSMSSQLKCDLQVHMCTYTWSWVTEQNLFQKEKPYVTCIT